MLEWGFWSGVLRAGFALIGMLPVLISVRIIVPGVRHVLCNVGRIHRVHFREIVIENRTTLQVEMRWILDASLRKVAVGEEIPQPLASSEPVAIEPSNREDVRDVDLIDEGLRLARQLGEKSDSLGIDCRLRFI